jgi:hypothetical protein
MSPAVVDRAELDALSPEVRALLAALERTLAPGVFADVLALAATIEEEATGRAVQEVNHRWERVLAHFPGLAPAIAHLDELEAHTDNYLRHSDCAPCQLHRPPPPWATPAEKGA